MYGQCDACTNCSLERASDKEASQLGTQEAVLVIAPVALASRNGLAEQLPPGAAPRGRLPGQQPVSAVAEVHKSANGPDNAVHTVWRVFPVSLESASLDSLVQAAGGDAWAQSGLHDGIGL